MSSISYDDIIDAWNKIEKLHKNSDGIDFVLVTNTYLIPTKNAWKMEYKGKTYLAMHNIVWQEVLKQSEIIDNSLMSFCGIPVIENDELLREILGGVCEEWLKNQTIVVGPTR